MLFRKWVGIIYLKRVAAVVAVVIVESPRILFGDIVHIVGEYVLLGIIGAITEDV